MTDTDRLLELATRCEAAAGEDLVLRQDIADYAESIGLLSVGDVIPAYETSLDAALTLVPEGCAWMVRSGPWAKVWLPDSKRHPNDFYSEAATPALAICAAALKARSQAQGGGNG